MTAKPHCVLLTPLRAVGFRGHRLGVDPLYAKLRDDLRSRALAAMPPR